MSAEEFEALVRECEAHAKRDRDGYTRRVRTLALQGYGYVLLVLLALLGTTALLVWSLRFHGATYRVLALAGPLVLLSRCVFHALRVPTGRPEGLRLRRTDAPELFALIDQLTRSLHAPRLHGVLLTEDDNALAQSPRLGPLGWYRNYLLVGLAQMQTLSAEEFQALVAHELGHLSRQDGRLGAWIYRIRMTWMRLEVLLQLQGRWGTGLFEWFLARWWPYFDAYSSVLAREREYEADRFAARIAGSDAFARSLARTRVTGTFLAEKFWPIVYRGAEENPEPPRDVFMSQACMLAAGPAPEDVRRWLDAELRTRTNWHDTHPALAERLGAVGIVPYAIELGAMPQPTAAQRYLGARLEALTAALSRSWHKRVAAEWAERHGCMARRRARLCELAANADVAAAWERAEIVLDLDGEDAALPLLLDLVARVPDHAPVNWALGQILADRDDENAVAHLERAMVGEVRARPLGHEVIAKLLERLGRDAEAVVHRRRAWDATDGLYRATVERRDVGILDALLPHGLSSDVVTRVRDGLEKLRELRAVWLVRKQLAHMPESPLYVLGILPSARVGDADLQRIGQCIPLPGQVLVIVAGPILKRKLQRVPASRTL
jgi:Zn-dependent protease with chaperone function